MSKFKPMLAPNESVDLDKVNYPIFASYKLDGIRCLFIKGELLSRSLKQIQNKQLREKFEALARYSEEHDVILDGEIYSPEFTFQEITRYVMTKDFEDEKSVKKHGEVLIVPDHLKFHLFDVVTNEKFDENFTSRTAKGRKIASEFPELIEEVVQFPINKQEEVQGIFDGALEKGYEGLILKSGSGKYKTGRGTLKEGLIFKVKPFVTFDAHILGVVQATKVDPNAEVKINELGRSVTSKKEEDRIYLEKASGFHVDYGDDFVFPTLPMTDAEKEEVWANQEDYIGKVIEYKGMLIGSKDVPRHPVMIRFREDKDEN